MAVFSGADMAFVYEGFLTDLECDHLISLAKENLQRSAVADNDNGESQVSDVRTSSGMFISKAKDPVVSDIEDKLSTCKTLHVNFFVTRNPSKFLPMDH
ncbi:prolyl 4-hydroxylase 2-like [Eutrema salsugineum]|uniref:prolyl 4-hydroxylase 2-like n=1 Tax=Eutrema salsugineum TaxID=72664 RepID=UPI000CECE9F1|nr:prolyl 4-hydroxylase 2-like [Eutrema salsugineum]